MILYRPLNIHGCWRAVFFVTYQKLLRLMPRRLPCLPEGYFFGTMATRRAALLYLDQIAGGPDSRQMRRIKDAARMQNHSTGDQGVPGVPGEVSCGFRVRSLPLLWEGRYLLLKRTPARDDFYHLINGQFYGETWDAISRYVSQPSRAGPSCTNGPMISR